MQDDAKVTSRLREGTAPPMAKQKTLTHSDKQVIPLLKENGPIETSEKHHLF